MNHLTHSKITQTACIFYDYDVSCEHIENEKNKLIEHPEGSQDGNVVYDNDSEQQNVAHRL